MLVVQDIISLRCNYIHDSNYESLLFESVKKAQHTVFISDFTKDDFISYFSFCPRNFSVIRHGVEESFSSGESLHTLIIGNHYSHKCLEEVLHSIDSRIETKIILLGTIKYNYSFDLDIEYFDSGTLNHEQISTLYRNASTIVYPSDLSFGLPISVLFHLENQLY